MKKALMTDDERALLDWQQDRHTPVILSSDFVEPDLADCD